MRVCVNPPPPQKEKAQALCGRIHAVSFTHATVERGGRNGRIGRHIAAEGAVASQLKDIYHVL